MNEKWSCWIVLTPINMLKILSWSVPNKKCIQMKLANCTCEFFTLVEEEKIQMHNQWLN